MRGKTRPALRLKKNRLLLSAKLEERKARRRQRLVMPKPIQRMTQWRGG